MTCSTEQESRLGKRCLGGGGRSVVLKTLENVLQLAKVFGLDSYLGIGRRCQRPERSTLR